MGTMTHWLILAWLLGFCHSCCAAITDLKLVTCDADRACPDYPGYKKLAQDLNQGTGLTAVYLHVKDSEDAPPITNLQLVEGSHPPVIPKWTRLPVNLNAKSTTTEADENDDHGLWLYYTKDTSISHNPVYSIIIKKGSHPTVSTDFTRLPINLNKGVVGETMYMFYSTDGPKDPISAITAKACFTNDCYMEGWYRVEKDANKDVFVGMRVYLFYKRDWKEGVVTDVVLVVDGQTAPEGYVRVDTDLNYVTLRGDSIHLWYKVKENPSEEDRKNAVQELAIQYGSDTVTPVGWTKLDVDLNSKDEGSGSFGEPTFLYIRKGYTALPPQPKLVFDSNGSFKILQLSDLHFTNDQGKCRDVPATRECHGDATTIAQMEKLLDKEKPNLVVFGGDNIAGDEVSDARAATFKFAEPVIQRKIPWVAVFGETDDLGDLSREELFEVMRRMPYSMMNRAFLPASGVGNFALQIFSAMNATEHAFTLYFLDSHGYLDSIKRTYMELQQDQMDWLLSTSTSFTKDDSTPNAMIFFHVPIWEFHDENGLYDAKLGDQRESVSSPEKDDVAIIQTFQSAGDIKVVACGHDHVNDYCLQRDNLQLCYSGGFGVGGYGAEHLGWPRRARLFDLNDNGNTIHTWKRLDNHNLTMLHFQTLL
ncbi:Metallo-dependent phosphatase-like protein [Radiomyces spectabilis]|uniref:Metallo-dependent phosphatase-like protein n=1 Tax=Radiomyces spectabilis TaxID=64574 RepID=UPI002220994E|nr:Metallo-dependent phosphatase-like protein [Radiomyces spectabilis]KAI8388188.1 Metallo-dependent phosphatase-like protein [Radiomyces spectabilis]